MIDIAHPHQIREYGIVDGQTNILLVFEHIFSLKVWSSSHPPEVLYYKDMKLYSWKYTQFSQFNSTDKLLLVSGVHFGSSNTSGEIAVFNLEGKGCIYY